jgi:RHS repeat-associated protein
VALRDYSAFGDRHDGLLDTGVGPRYTGKEFDSDTGLYYFNARWYDPDLGRFISEDPIKDGANWYAYVGNRPLVSTDPTGLFTDPLKGTYTVTGKFGSSLDAGRGPALDRHAGVDFVSSTREVVAARSGTVVFAGKHPDGTSVATGTLIVIDYGDNKYGVYGHLDPDMLNVSVGATVEEGADLGKYFDGSMGTSTGGHLHYEEYYIPDAPSDEDALARFFNGTGYFYDSAAVPDNLMAKNSAGTEVTVVKPDNNEWVEQ